jgi:hypothetical protein
MRSFVSNNINNALHLASICFAAVLATAGHATTWYVDSSATGTHNGTSWTNAWTAFSQIAGVAPGDTVLISGGASGSTKTYSFAGDWVPKSGSATAKIAYQIGQDSAHNGTAILNLNGNSLVASSVQHVVISGDAGDGAQHFQANAAGRLIDASGSTDLRVAYLKVPSANKGLAYFNGGTQIEIDHCYYYKVVGSSSDDDNAIYFDVSGSTWDVNKIHDCEFHVPRSGDGDGDDIIQSGDSGISVYNNKLISYASSYPRGQHGDGWQPLGGSYYKFYGNYCQDIANYALFGDAYYGDFTHFWVYNNIVVLADPTLQAGNAPQGIAIGPDGGDTVSNPTISNVTIANNLIVDYGTHSAISLWRPPTAPVTSFVNCLVVNNIGVNSDGMQLDPSIATSSNVMGITTAQAVSDFLSFVDSSSTNDYHYKSTAQFFAKGQNLFNTFFTTDKDGNTRPASGSWSVGPYEVNGSPTPTP